MPIVRAIVAVLLAATLLAAAPAHARSAHARIARITLPTGTMSGVRIDVDWPANAPRGALRLRADRVDAPDLGYRFSSLDWRCVLRRDGWSRWHCDGPAVTREGGMRLRIDLSDSGVDAMLARGASTIHVERDRTTGEATRVDLSAIPLAWMHALLAKAWADGQLKSGSGDAHLMVTTPNHDLRIKGPLTLRDVGFDTPDGTIAAQGLDAKLDLDMTLGATDRVALRGRLGDGELLFGTAYLALAGRMGDLSIDAEQRGDCCWRIPRFDWRDDGVLQASGGAAFGPDAALRSLQADVHSADLAGLKAPYLTGWLDAAGLDDLALRGRLDAHVDLGEQGLRAADARLAAVDVDDPKGRFAFRGLEGDIRYSADVPVDSALRWSSGHVYGLDFGASTLPMRSEAGRIAFAQPVDVPMLGGRVRFDHLSIQPPTGDAGANAQFGLDVENLDIGELAKALGLPAFTGQLSGRIPNAHYAAQQLVFDGGLSMALFGGRLDVSALSMERPFGVAPTLSADIAFDDLDLESLTGVLGFGSITGKLDGHLNGLRLVDWQPVAFDAHLRTDKHVGVRQRISQRAVQDLSSVGDSSFAGGLQARLIGLFDDFAYSAIGIDCRLADEVCEMGGLSPRGPNSFSIVEGGGIPWLTVIGINRRVDWPTLVERLVAVGKGEAKPVVH
ncbi:hypothetical protein [Cognatilysobacter terrigena]|uniref:hypothetical protein n=1 Tax=Cognatilysobacter terrigena TaxID=2488749 RepID=UPI0014150FD4|nr:hypothetical protein [Lysobacter terrigena]